jgi:TonB-linked SusC/RagA family outer membrane protein
MQAYANYQKKLGLHSLNAMLGYEEYQYNYENLSASRTNYTLKDFPYLDLGSEDYQYNNGNAQHYAYRSFFGRLIYSYADKYMLQANLRSDGSSRFAKGHRWGTFPSISAGWVMSEESWFKKGGAIDYLKLRASIGKLGNERIGSYFPYQALLNFGNTYLYNNSTSSVEAQPTAAQTTYAFNNITWETTTTYDVGVDINMFRNRLHFSGDLYYKKTTNMLLVLGFPLYSGYNAPDQNAGDMHTTGWDVDLSWKDNIGELNYGVSFNISDYRSKMGYLGDKRNISGNYITEKGSYYNEWYLYKNKGIILNESAMYDADGKKIPVLTNNDKPGCIQYIDVDGDGKITASNDRVRSGNSLPEYQYGGSIFADWRNFDFNITFQGIGHQRSYITTGMLRAYDCQWTSIPSILIGNHWSPSNSDEQNSKMRYPMLTSTNTANTLAGSDFYLFNGAYMRIKNITLGYTIPKIITQKFYVNKLRVYFSINDLPAFNKYPKGFDPEWEIGNDFLTTSYVFGINFTF